MAGNDEFKESSFLIDVSTVITLLAALLYTAGWSFAYHYYDKFHLGLIGLDIPKEYFFVYSFWVIRDQPFLALSSLLVTLLLYFLVKLCFHRAKKAMKTRSSEQGRIWEYELFLAIGLLLVPLMIFFLFSGFYYLGKSGASLLYEKQALHDFESYPRVKVFLTKDISEQGKVKEWEKGCYKLLLRNKEHLYLFIPETYKSDNHRNISPTDIIRQSDVKAVRALPLYNKCNVSEP